MDAAAAANAARQAGNDETDSDSDDGLSRIPKKKAVGLLPPGTAVFSQFKNAATLKDEQVRKLESADQQENGEEEVKAE